MASSPTPLEAILTLLRPLYLISLALPYIPLTILATLNPLNKSTPLSTLLSWSAFKSAWFARFWTYFGPLSSANAQPAVRPLLHQHARGKILDIGTGQGHLLSLYDAEKVEKVYAVELNRNHHAILLDNARKAGLLESGKFEIVDARIEELDLKTEVKKGGMDTVVTLQTLCSMGDESRTLIRELRTYLRSGGKWVVFEHVKRRDTGSFVAVWQAVLDLIWPQCFNACSLTRETSTWIEQTGDWAEGVGGLKPLDTDSAYSVIPTVAGYLVSK